MKPEFQKTVDLYFSGQLTSEEIDELWAELIEDPEKANYFAMVEKTYAAVHTSSASLNSAIEEKPVNYRPWVSVAATFLFIALLTLLLRDSNTNDFRIRSIDLLMLESGDITRSNEADISSLDSLINEGLQAFVNGDTLRSFELYDLIIENHPESEYSAYAAFNKAVILFNKGDYTDARYYFEHATKPVETSTFFKEKAYWFLGNTLINLGDFEKARDTILMVYQYGGDYQQPSFVLLKSLDQQIRHQFMDQSEEINEIKDKK